MNHFVGLGRLTREPEVSYTQNGKVYCKFTVAIDRPFRKDQPKEADFINCIAFGKTGEAIGNYFHKGSRILVNGSLQISSYTDKNGNKRTAAEVVCGRFEFIERREQSGSQGEPQGMESFGQQVPFNEEIPF